LGIPNGSPKTTSHKVATWRRGARINIDQTPSRQKAEREQGGSRGSRREQEGIREEQRGSREVLAADGRRQASDHMAHPRPATFYLGTYVCR